MFLISACRLSALTVGMLTCVSLANWYDHFPVSYIEGIWCGTNTRVLYDTCCYFSSCWDLSPIAGDLQGSWWSSSIISSGMSRVAIFSSRLLWQIVHGTHYRNAPAAALDLYFMVWNFKPQMRVYQFDIRKIRHIFCAVHFIVKFVLVYWLLAAGTPLLHLCSWQSLSLRWNLTLNLTLTLTVTLSLTQNHRPNPKWSRWGWCNRCSVSAVQSFDDSLQLVVMWLC